MIIRPAVNFDEGARYIVALRNLKDAGGRGDRAEPGVQGLSRPADDDHSPARGRGAAPAHGGPLHDARGSRHQRERLYLAWDFTVASGDSLTNRALGMRDDAFAQLGDDDLSDLKSTGSRRPSRSRARPTCRLRRRRLRRAAPRRENPPGGHEFCDALKTVTSSRLLPFARSSTATCCPARRRARATRSPAGSRARSRCRATCTFRAVSPAARSSSTRRRAARPRTRHGYSANFVCNIPRAAFATATRRRGTAVPRPSLYGHGLLGTASEVNARQHPGDGQRAQLHLLRHRLGRLRHAATSRRPAQPPGRLQLPEARRPHAAGLPELHVPRPR